MNTAEITFEQVLQMAQRLPVPEQTRLAACLTPAAKPVEVEQPFKSSLWGALAHLGPAPSAEEINEARREMWANFPREDV
jgi:hypothetical protein